MINLYTPIKCVYNICAHKQIYIYIYIYILYCIEKSYLKKSGIRFPKVFTWSFALGVFPHKDA